MHRLAEIPTAAPKEWDKKKTKEETAVLVEELNELQNKLYAGGEYSVLVVLQGMDASGKDGVVRKVFGQLNPLGVQAHPFKVPTEEEAAHDFLWRVHKHAPVKGMIQVFNRSHYEDVLVTRVHGWCDDKTAMERFDAINDFERLLLLHNKTQIFKFYLHLSPEEQQLRLKERMEDPTKHWKHNDNDFKEATLWDKYMQAYEDVFQHCNAVPWHIIPADNNWYKEHLIAKTVTESLRTLNMEYPGLKKKI
jgi:PPK2 family polyphosphate:nucleotide phosphotransferase